MILIIHIDKFTEVGDVVFRHVPFFLHGDKQNGKRTEDHLLALLPFNLLLKRFVQLLSFILSIKNLAANSMKEGHGLLAKPSRLFHACRS